MCIKVSARHERDVHKAAELSSSIPFPGSAPLAAPFMPQTVQHMQWDAARLAARLQHLRARGRCLAVSLRWPWIRQPTNPAAQLALQRGSVAAQKGAPVGSSAHAEASPRADAGSAAGGRVGGRTEQAASSQGLPAQGTVCSRQKLAKWLWEAGDWLAWP
jgi:hypothetical protein